jgi:hypothetical protein
MKALLRKVFPVRNRDRAPSHPVEAGRRRPIVLSFDGRVVRLSLPENGNPIAMR